MGTCQFTEILVESEMDVNALVGGVFHYASVVGSALAPAPSLPNHPQTLDLDLFQSLAGKGMEDFGMAVVKIAMGSGENTQKEYFHPSESNNNPSLRHSVSPT